MHFILLGAGCPQRRVRQPQDQNQMREKLKVVRVVTASFVVPWHLHNTITRMPRDFDPIVVGQGVSAYRGDYPGVGFFDIDIHRKHTMLADLKALWALAAFLRVAKPDILHSIMPKAGLLSALAGFVCRVPMRIHTFTGQTWVGRRGIARFVYWSVDRLINALNHVCLTDSPSQSAFLAQHKIMHRGRPLPVLSLGSLSGVDLARFNRPKLEAAAQAVRHELNLGPGHFLFAYIARKTVEKGAVDMLRAFSKVVQANKFAYLLFLGPDEDGEIAHLHQSEPALFENVLEVGPVGNHEDYLAATDVLCAPSYREGFGSVVIDAAALGVPTLGSRIPGFVEAIVESHTGLLFEAGDIRDLARLMLKVMEDAALREILGRQAKQRAEQYFSADTLYQALKDFYLQTQGRQA